jgi:hypothetical protein
VSETSFFSDYTQVPEQYCFNYKSVLMMCAMCTAHGGQHFEQSAAAANHFILTVDVNIVVFRWNVTVLSVYRLWNLCPFNFPSHFKPKIYYSNFANKCFVCSLHESQRMDATCSSCVSSGCVLISLGVQRIL